ncbi:sugar efflux transporter B [Salmonella enterica subsp. enterica serovar Enteritidis str. 22558]|nr:sugar efflux transporter B [Salmonella enterica subsp. enterica serovar Enteritidis str. 22558]
MVGFFFTGSAVIGIIVSQFLAGRSDKKAIAKTDRFLLRAGHVGLRAVCLEPQLLYFAVYRRLSQ